MIIELTPTQILRLGAILLGVQEANPGTTQAEHANELLGTICNQVDERLKSMAEHLMEEQDKLTEAQEPSDRPS